jgi:hypothetical protein
MRECLTPNRRVDCGTGIWSIEFNMGVLRISLGAKPALRRPLTRVDPLPSRRMVLLALLARRSCPGAYLRLIMNQNSHQRDILTALRPRTCPVIAPAERTRSGTELNHSYPLKGNVHRAAALPFKILGVAGLHRGKRCRQMTPFLATDENPQDCINDFAWWALRTALSGMWC